MTFLRFRFDSDPNDDVGQLWLHVRTHLYSGAAFFWSDRHGLGELAKELGEYPFAKPIRWERGYDEAQANDAVLRVRIEPLDSVGHLMAYGEIADLYDPEVRLSAKLPTTYSAIADFQRQLTALAEGSADEAELRAEL